MIQAGMSPEQIDAEIAAAKFPGNFTEEKQNVVELPKNLKTGPDAEETQLAYITPDEQALLAFMKPGTPHVGPEDVPSYDSYDYGVYTTGEQMSNYESGYKQGTKADKKAAKASMADRKEARNEAAQDTGSQYHDQAVREQNIEKEMGGSDFKDWLNKSSQISDTITDTITDTAVTGDTNITGFSSGDQDKINAIVDMINSGNKEGAKNLMSSYDQSQLASFSNVIPGMIAGGAGKAIWDDFMGGDKDRKDEVEKDKDGEFKKIMKSLIKGPVPMMIAGAGKMLHDFKVTPEKLQDQNYLAIMKAKLSPEKLKAFEKKHAGVIADAYGPRGGTEAFETALAGAVAPVGSEAERRTDPKAYYTQPERDPEGKFFQPVSSRFANTIGNLEDIAGIDVNTVKDPDFKQRIFDAREEVSRQKYDQGIGDRPGDRRPIGAGGEDLVTKIDTIDETTTTDPRAGQYNVGGTMPYTEDIRTAGVETDVPLGRRFQIDKEGKYRGTTGMDLSEAMKYATLGGYSQLEPFQEYLARRRKHLGEDEPRYFDEEGNVIFSETT
jgi:hypothetical protein